MVTPTPTLWMVTSDPDSKATVRELVIFRFFLSRYRYPDCVLGSHLVLLSDPDVAAVGLQLVRFDLTK